jgi:head-tail adaptor
VALKAGDLDRRITILRPVEGDDGFQTVGGEPAELMTVWAQVTPIRDGERFAGGVLQATLTSRFLIRWSQAAAGILATDLIRHEGVLHGIAAPPKEVGRRVGIELTGTTWSGG